MVPAVPQQINEAVNLLISIIRLATLLRDIGDAVGPMHTRHEQLTNRENHNWNTTCIGIMTIATIIMIGLFGSIQLGADGLRPDLTAVPEQLDSGTSTAVQKTRESTPNGAATDTFDNPCPNDIATASEDNDPAETFMDKAVRWIYGIVPSLISSLAAWAVGAYLGCVFLSLHAIFGDFSTRQTKIAAVRDPSSMLLIEAVAVGIIAIFTIILAEY